MKKAGIIMNIRAIIIRFIREKKGIVIAASVVFLAVIILIITQLFPKNPLLDGWVEEQRVLDTSGSGGSYTYDEFYVHCVQKEIESLTQKKYINFLKKGIEGRADEIGVYVVTIYESTTAIIYLNGDSSKGYYVDYTPNLGGHEYDLSPTDARCIVKGIISWNGMNVSYSAMPNETPLGSILDRLDPKYKK